MADRQSNVSPVQLLNGKKVSHGLPLSLPRVEPTESVLDAALLDVMSAEDFIALYNRTTDGNPGKASREMNIIIQQLKASRELLAIGSSLYSNKVTKSIIERLIEASHIILGAERMYLLELDTTGTQLVVTYAKEQQAIGQTLPINIGIEGKSWYLNTFKH